MAKKKIEPIVCVGGTVEKQLVIKLRNILLIASINLSFSFTFNRNFFDGATLLSIVAVVIVVVEPLDVAIKFH